MGPADSPNPGLVDSSNFHLPFWTVGVGLVITKGCVSIGFVIEPGGQKLNSLSIEY